MIFWLGLGFAAGLALLVSEFLLPHLVAGALGILLIIVSVGWAIFLFPASGILILAGAFATIAMAMAFGGVLLTRTRAGRRLALTTANSAAGGYVSAVSNTDLIGQTGVVVTALRPAGTIRLGGCRLDAVSNGGFIGDDIPVQVLEVHGSRVVVEQLKTANGDC